jgi:hypothetical protein
MKLKQEFEDMKAQIHYEMTTEIASFREAWRRYRKRVIIAIIVQTMTSLSGVNVISKIHWLFSSAHLLI